MRKMILPVPRESGFTSRLRSPAVAARVGVWLGICFLLAFVTGLYSHLSQAGSTWVPLPTGPSWLYRVTQGLHVISGTAAVPLLLVKLWTVFPKLFARLPRGRRQVLLQGLERGSIAVLVAAAVFELATGLANAAQWYPWGFTFPATHYAVGWLAIGALLVHIAVKLPVIRTALTRDVDDTSQDRPGAAAVDDALTRRGLLRVTWLAAGVAVLATAGATVPSLRHVSVFGVRSGNGPGGIPINKSAQAAGVLRSAAADDFALTVTAGDRHRRVTRAELEAMPQVSATLPIACVEGWSASGTWTGVRVRDVMALVGAPVGTDLVVTSLQAHGPYRQTRLPGNFVADPTTLLALALAGKPLSLDHGYPCRIIAPARPGVLQTKWVSSLAVEG